VIIVVEQSQDTHLSPTDTAQCCSPVT